MWFFRNIPPWIPRVSAQQSNSIFWREVWLHQVMNTSGRSSSVWAEWERGGGVSHKCTLGSQQYSWGLQVGILFKGLLLMVCTRPHLLKAANAAPPTGSKYLKRKPVGNPSASNYYHHGHTYRLFGRWSNCHGRFQSSISRDKYVTSEKANSISTKPLHYTPEVPSGPQPVQESRSKA